MVFYKDLKINGRGCFDWQVSADSHHALWCCQHGDNQSFPQRLKTALQYPTGDITEALSILYRNYSHMTKTQQIYSTLTLKILERYQFLMFYRNLNVLLLTQ